MKKLTDSYIFKLQNSTGIISNKIQAVLKKGAAGFADKDIVVLNTHLSDSLQNMKRMYNDPIVIDIINSINRGEMVLVKLSVEYSIPKCLPFIKYSGSQGGAKVLVNLSNYVDIKKTTTGEELYSISAQRLYPILVSAYLALHTFTDNYILPAVALHNSSYIWAAMFNKVLCKAVALGTNADRYDMFMYFAMKYFCIDIAQVPEQIAENTARQYLQHRGKKNFPMLEETLSKINERQLEPYSSFETLCQVLFNNEITGLRISSPGSNGNLNMTVFINRFVDLYKYEALFALASYPYFLFAIMNASFKTRVVNDNSFQEVIGDRTYNSLALINSLV